ncbi:outer membrane protein with glycine zipper [Roseibium hamelinense]|uniref:Outer membrane protein with glycine zipper n=1 Tax=Roseibium hamelinense TaxID=150831 RepID=A0A562T9P3_9HYPH|nr:bacteriocin [Roseibium hamelinense]MTI45338.1 bacteriocin [Roseibium hamelinense]TWI90295.1 outer membrane protein with glycine zipper [Roseibium hamelinense]
MKRLLIVLAATLPLAGCISGSDTERDRILIGGGLGAATGAALGAAAGSTAGWAFAGAAIGAVGGGVIGAVTAPRECVAQLPDGTPYNVRCP